MTSIYVCGFMLDPMNYLLLVRKNRPAWQSGFLNGIGGKVEFAEEPRVAMHREWAEETGDTTQHPWVEFCRLDGNNFGVHFFKCRTQVPHHYRLERQRVNDVGETLHVVPRGAVISGGRTVIANLRWLVPMAFHDEAFEPRAHVVNALDPLDPGRPVPPHRSGGGELP